MTITAAVDGSALGNPGPAGWAWVVSEDCWDSGGWDHGTNNLGELTAVLQLLRATAEAGLGGEPLHVLADSQYAINTVTKWRHGWKKRGWQKADKKPIKNLEVVKALDEAMQGRTVTFEWVRGHAGHAMNERADDLARAAAEDHQRGRVAPGGPGFSGLRPGGTGTGTGMGGDPSAGGTQPARPAGAVDTEADETEVLDAEKAFVRAWAGGDAEALRALSGPDARRVWSDGSSSRGLGGPVPAGLRIGRMRATAVGDGAWLVVYRMSWEDGTSLESSVWSPAKAREGGSRVRLIWHQSTPRS
ncbi:MAG: RNase H family protein [Pauljensenia sp.]